MTATTKLRLATFATLALLLPSPARAGGLTLTVNGTGSAALLADEYDPNSVLYSSSGDLAQLDLWYQPSPYAGSDGMVFMQLAVDVSDPDDPYLGPYVVTAGESDAAWFAEAGSVSFTDLGPGGYSGSYTIGPAGDVSAMLTISQSALSYSGPFVQLAFQGQLDPQSSTAPEPSSLVLGVMAGLCLIGTIRRYIEAQKGL